MRNFSAQMTQLQSVIKFAELKIVFLLFKGENIWSHHRLKKRKEHKINPYKSNTLIALGSKLSKVGKVRSGRRDE